ncbi:unnamed protein product [Lampetra planeri]
MATSEKGSEALLAEHRDNHLSNSSPPSGKERYTFRARLVELLEAVAAMVGQLDREEPAVEERAPELRGVEHPVAVSRQRESSMPPCGPPSRLGADRFHASPHGYGDASPGGKIAPWISNGAVSRIGCDSPQLRFLFFTPCPEAIVLSARIVSECAFCVRSRNNNDKDPNTDWRCKCVHRCATAPPATLTANIGDQYLNGASASPLVDLA